MNINICNHFLACLKQQRSVAFSSCKSVEIFSPGVSWALKCTLFPLNIMFYLTMKKINKFKHDNLCLACLKQKRSSAFISCKSVGNISPGVFLGTKMYIILTIIVWSVNNEERKCFKYCNLCLACVTQYRSLCPGVSWTLILFIGDIKNSIKILSCIWKMFFALVYDFSTNACIFWLCSLRILFMILIRKST